MKVQASAVPFMEATVTLELTSVRTTRASLDAAGQVLISLDTTHRPPRNKKQYPEIKHDTRLRTHWTHGVWSVLQSVSCTETRCMGCAAQL
eukprot:2980138-Rhodomonas_salina.1